MNIVGIDIGGTKCAAVLGEQTADGRIAVIDKTVFSTEVEKGFNHSLHKIFAGIDETLARHGIAPGRLGGMGISCGGPLDARQGLIMSPPNLLGWDNVPIVALLEERFGVKTRLQNDANACALAEWRYGAGRGCRNMIFLTFGTGLGAGMILNGRLYSGANDMAGEVGHIRLAEWGPVGYGKAGSFEGFCSGGGIAQLARVKVLEKLQAGEKVSFCAGVEALNDLTAKTVSDAAHAGDELAREIYRICGHFLGKGLAVLIDILNPERIVIGSIFARSQDLISESMQAAIEAESLSHAAKVCRVVPAGLGEAIGDYAALAVALYETERE